MSEKSKQETGRQQEKEQLDERIWQWVGVDVAKDSFVAAFYNAVTDSMSEPLEFDPDRKGVRRFLSWMKKLAGKVLPAAVVMESTGCYSSRLADLMLKLDSSLHVSICNACSVSHYIKSHSANKTDKADARLIARYGHDSQPARLKVKSPEERLLRELVSERKKLVRYVSSLTSKGKTLDFKETKEINRKTIAFLKKQIEELDRRIAEAGRQTEEIDKEIDLMDSVPGVGRLSASVVYGTFGSLRQYTRKQLSALSGLCPAISQSGSSPARGKLSKKGPSYLRSILYLCTTPAMKKIPQLRELRERLLARENSCKMTAKCACMRKLLLIMKGVVDSGVPYDPDYQQKKQEKSSKVA